MPFPQAEYEKDFKGAEKAEEPPLSANEDLAQFHALLARAGDAWLALDGDQGPAKNAAYEAVGRFVVRHCDLLIAIWDGGPGGGRGGRTVADLMQAWTQVMSRQQVMDGIAEMIGEIQVEATFPDGTKLVNVHERIRLR
jgi:hypothetical protein